MATVEGERTDEKLQAKQSNGAGELWIRRIERKMKL